MVPRAPHLGVGIPAACPTHTASVQSAWRRPSTHPPTTTTLGLAQEARRLLWQPGYQLCGRLGRGREAALACRREATVRRRLPWALRLCSFEWRGQRGCRERLVQSLICPSLPTLPSSGLRGLPTSPPNPCPPNTTDTTGSPRVGAESRVCLARPHQHPTGWSLQWDSP